MPKYIWINYTDIYRTISGKSINNLFIGPTNQLYKPINFYCDRTLPEPGIEVPEHLSLPDSRTAESWDQLTDNRCRELETLLRQGQGCTILWSGGIDSTYIVAAVIQSIDPALLANITIGLSAASIWENPYFYRDCITRYFKKIQDIEHSTMTPGTIVVSGTLGDKILCPEIIIQWAYENFGTQDLLLNRDAVLKFLSIYNQSLGKSAELYDLVLSSAKRANVVLTTVSDFLWWLSFNYAYVGMFYFRWNKYYHRDLPMIDPDNFNWFSDSSWQSWAMNQTGRWARIDDNWHREYKKAAKETIYRLDGNDHYLTWKQKYPSTTPLELSWKNFKNSRDWILAVDAHGNKYYTSDSRLTEDLINLGIDP